MAHSKVLTRLLLVALAISLLCQHSVARAPASGARRRALQDGPGDENDMPEDAESPGPSEDEDEDGSQEVMQEEAEEEAESQKYSDPEDAADPIDDTEVAVDEPPPQFEDVPPEAFGEPPAASSSEDQSMQEPQPDAPAADEKASGPSGVVVAFSVLAAIAVVAVVSGGAFFFVKRRREMKDLEFKPLRETELSNDNNGDKNDPAEQDEPTRKLQRSDSEA